MIKDSKTLLIFHIGYPKTGTTLLQKKVYPKLEEIHYIGKRYNPKEKNDSFFKKLINFFTKKERKGYGGLPWDYWIDLISFAPDGIYDKKLTSKILKKKINKNKVNLICSEGLIRIFSLEKTAKRLRELSLELNFNIKIIISVREQNSIIFSRYYQDVKVYHQSKKYKLIDSLQLGDKINCFAPSCKHNKLNDCACEFYGINAINKKLYDYYRTYELFKNYFGAENIHIIICEELFKDPEKALTRTFNFMEIKSNFDLNGFKNEPPENQRSEKEKNELDNYNGETELNKIRSELSLFYRESNLNLNKVVVDLDLKNYGYITNVP